MEKQRRIEELQLHESELLKILEEWESVVVQDQLALVQLQLRQILPKQLELDLMDGVNQMTIEFPGH